MATTDYKLGWNYYAKFTELNAPNYKYIHLPVNSTFALPSDFKMALYNIFGSITYVTDNFTVSGYDMSATGEYPLTISYTCPNGQIFTYTGITLIVFDPSTWRTLWSGNTNVELRGGKWFIDNAISKWNNGYSCYVCPVNSDTFEKYIGKDYIRKLRITCSVNSYESDYTFYIANTKGTYTPEVFQSIEFDFDYKAQYAGRGDTLDSNYSNVYKTIAINKYSQNGLGNQIIVGQIEWHGTYFDNALIEFNRFWDGGNSIRSDVELNYQDITITKIEVQG